MRWENGRKAALALTLALGLANTGCTLAVLQGAAESPGLLVALPFAMIGDAIMYGAKGSGSSGSPVAVALGNTAYDSSWRDPNDWVGECEGPLLCEMHMHFECRGVPGDCGCSCVVTLPGDGIARVDSGTSSKQARLSPAQ